MSLLSVKFGCLELRNVAGDWFLWIGVMFGKGNFKKSRTEIVGAGKIFE
jgi:hypothetical protein